MKQKDNGDSAAAKLARKKAARVDKTGASGMGMTKRGVEDRAFSAGYAKGETLYPDGIGESDKYSGLRKWEGYKGQPTNKGKKITDDQATQLMLDAQNKVRKNYGVPQAKKYPNPLDR
jgi:hypothetical protein